MATLDLSLPQAYLHLHLVSNRSFFVYPFDVGLLMRIEHKLEEGRSGRKATPPVSAARPHQTGSKWKPWGLGFARGPGSGSRSGEQNMAGLASPQPGLVPLSDNVLQHGFSSDRKWLESMHFDGSLPSQLLPTLYLGHL
jgi:dual specificity MAP kinase phosphatase